MFKFLLLPLALIPLLFSYMMTGESMAARPGWDPNGLNVSTVGPGWDPNGGDATSGENPDGDANSAASDISLGWDPNG